MAGDGIERVPWWTAVMQRRTLPGCGEVIGVQWDEDHGLVLMGHLGMMAAVHDPSIGHVDNYVEVESDTRDGRKVDR